jgi:multisubunit Na+/H+ antiporter MnhF subunit
VIAIAAASIIVGLLALSLWRLAAGPTLHDRGAAAWICVLLTALFAAALSVLDRRAEWLDLAVALLFADLVIGLALMKAFRARSLQSALARREGDAG